MARITIQSIKDYLGVSETYDIVNAILNESPDTFSQYVPLASANNIAEVSAGLQISKTLQNEFAVNLIDRIGLVIVQKASLENPLKKFKKGAMPQGRTIEEVFTDLVKGQKYNPDDAESTLYKRVIPNVHVMYYERNRQDVYTQTVSDEQLRSAFVSWTAFENFLSSIINAIYNSAEVDEFESMKLMIDNYYAKGFFTVVNVLPPVDQASASDFVKKARAVARKMSLPNGSRDYNSLAVRTRSDMSDLHLIIDADLEAELDVDVLAKAFNMDRTSFLGNVTVIDGFASTGLEAVLVDKEWFMVYDNLFQLETVRNSKGLYYNYFLHVWQLLATSRFANAVAFVSGTVPAVTSVIIDSAIIGLKQGTTHEFTAYVRATDGADHNPTWSVSASTSGTTLLAGTTIDANGVLTIDPNQTGELLVRATVAGAGIDIDGAGADTTDVIGESIVTVTT